MDRGLQCRQVSPPRKKPPLKGPEVDHFSTFFPGLKGTINLTALKKGDMLKPNYT